MKRVLGTAAAIGEQTLVERENQQLREQHLPL
jgi:hypothetical protein